MYVLVLTTYDSSDALVVAEDKELLKNFAALREGALFLDWNEYDQADTPDQEQGGHYRIQEVSRLW